LTSLSGLGEYTAASAPTAFHAAKNEKLAQWLEDAERKRERG
jgi:hypothetical protein